MRIEIVPLILGGLVALLGLGLLVDAWTPDDMLVSRERRRRPRAERDRAGEAFVGIGVLAMAAAFLGRDTWDWSIVAVIAGVVALLIGVWRNRPFLRELVVNRGPLRRGLPASRVPAATEAPAAIQVTPRADMAEPAETERSMPAPRPSRPSDGQSRRIR